MRSDLMPVRNAATAIARLVCLTALLFFTSIPALAETADEDADLTITSWLKLGPAIFQMPVFHDERDIRGNKPGPELFFEGYSRGILQSEPSEGLSRSLPLNGTMRWQVRNSETDRRVMLPLSETVENAYSVTYLATYIHSDRWAKATITINTPAMAALYINGERHIMKASAETATAEPGEQSAEIELSQGRHLVMVKLLGSRSQLGSVSFPFKTFVRLADGHSASLQQSLRPAGPLSLQHLMTTPESVGVSLSADGSIVAVHMRQANTSADGWDSWIEMRDFSTGRILNSFRGSTQISGMQWSHQDKIFSYVARNGSKSTVWVIDLENGTQEPVLKDVEHLQSHLWAPDGRALYYSVSIRPDQNNTGVRRLDGMHDRYPDWRHRSRLFKLDLASAASVQLTAGLYSTNLHDISPDGTRLILGRTYVDYSERPFSKHELFIFEPRTGKMESLTKAPWVSGARFSPDGSRLLFTGSPNAFGDVGNTLDTLANDYDTQAYIMNLTTRTIISISRDLDPSVNAAMWSPDGRSVFLAVTEKSFNTVYRYDTRNYSLTKVETGVEMASGFSIARNAERAAFIGHGMNDPQKVYRTDLRRNRSSVIVFPGEDAYRNVHFGTAKDWVFTLDDGTEIDGHVYYPANFDADKKYPVIVYYYGGTTPVTRAFSGRYPKELYAAHGYLVYVLQPSGAIGYGQEFSQRHINDWGIRVSGEIIEGTTRFLEAHPYADADRVGAIGASYGGFMTQLLLTETDIFAAGVSHAGISNITSYWGDGFWGYLYSSVASANSFPWDTPEIYIQQSPIFHADQINTPLLLLHGLSDTNVPPAESMQLYTALKLLGRDVEYVKIEQQDHHIVDFRKFILWKNTIISYFDKYLKDQPEWWDTLHP
ncbi:MAG: prolyl oligopeptidase family serine peptidase [Balneolales bacterium]|nr:prolyl oligopeptidase family serine peptidase [Balneolales bacterium]